MTQRSQSAATRILQRPGQGAVLVVRRAHLAVEGSSAKPLALEGQPLSIGTAASCDLVLDDAAVSAVHCRLRPTREGFLLEDCGSTNGSFVDGYRVQAIYLPDSAELRLGDTRLRFAVEADELELALSRRTRFGQLLGHSDAMRQVFAILERVADTQATVLVEGESGTGKELAARGLHETSSRAGEPFVAVDCGALPESLLDSELFGHVRGAFTGAATARAGAFARAHGGTLFLDELDSVPLAAQARLLRIVEERRLRPVGGDEERDIDVRLVGAARRDLRALVAEGAFRPDLYYRLSVLRVVLPPLRDRREDIAPIVAAMLRGRGLEVPLAEISGANLERLMAHDWPGNVRELRNVVDRAVALAPGAQSFAELRLAVAPHAGSAEALTVRSDLTFAEAKQQLLAAFEGRYLRDVLARCEGNISAASREASVDRKHLRTLLRRHGLLEEPSGT